MANDLREPTQAEISEMRSWLRHGHGTPANRAGLLSRLLRDPAQRLPVLIHFATRYEGDDVKKAVSALNRLVAAADTVELLSEILKSLPRKSVNIADAAVRVMDKILKLLPEELKTSGPEAAQYWNNLSERAQDANQNEKALMASQKAVEISGRLAKDDPEHSRIRTQCLMTRSKRHAERGEKDEAMADAEKAWSAASGLVELSPADRLIGVQAGTIRSNRLADLGKWDKAVNAASEAAQALALHPDAETLIEDAAVLELSMANSLIHLGSHEESLPHSDKADRLFRMLSGSYPDQYLEYTAAAAAAYAQNLQHTGNLQRSYQLSLENYERMSRWVKQQPERFRRDFVAHLICLSDSAGDMGFDDDSLRFGREAIAQAAKLRNASGLRDYYLEGVAHSNLFNKLYPRQEFQDAEKAARAAVRCFGKLSASHPEAIPEQARALRNLAELQRVVAGSGQEEMSVKTARKSIDILSSFNGNKSDAFLLVEAHCLSTLANCLEEAGRYEEASKEERKSLSLREALFFKSNRQYRTDLAHCLLQLARQLLAMGDRDEALRVINECTRHYETAIESSPDSQIVFYGQALAILADTQIAMGLLEQGKATVERALKKLVPYHQKLSVNLDGPIASLTNHYLKLFGGPEEPVTPIP